MYLRGTIMIVHYWIVISSENEWKYEEVAQDVAYTTLLAFNDINAAHLLML